MLDLTRLKDVRHVNGKTLAERPVCAETGGNEKGGSLFVAENGAYGCSNHPGDTEHRKIIFVLAGDRKEKPLLVRCPPSKPPKILETEVLGRLGRVFNTHYVEKNKEGEGINIKHVKDYCDPVPSVPKVIEDPIPVEVPSDVIRPAEPFPASDVLPSSLVRDASELDEIAASVREAGVVALDIETYGPGKKDGLNPWRGDIRLLSLKVEGRDPWLIDLQATGYDLGQLRAALESALVIGHNLKFDALWLRVKCGVSLPKVFCTLTAARLLSAGTQPGNNLSECLERYLGVEPGEDCSTSSWGDIALTDSQLAYAARDVAYLDKLRAALVEELDSSNLTAVAELEMALIPVVVDIEEAGFAVDRAKLQALRDEAIAEKDAKAAEVRQKLSAPELNLNSAEQLKAALRSVGVEVADAGAETLKASGDTRYVPLILEYKDAKSQAQQTTTILESISADGRIHGRFEPMGTATGRFSSKEPNLQNIGRGAQRQCFIAPEGCKLIVADYSQIELRAVAAVAGETRMIEAYQRGEDLHRGTAAAVLGKPVEDVTKADRQLAKAVNFGLLYGQYPAGLVRYAASSYGVTLTEEKAKEIRAKFFSTYGALQRWHSRSWQQAEGDVSESRTILGRRRLIPQEESKWNRFTALVNTPIQGSCADGMKRALVQLAAQLPASARIISTVHDEIIVEAPENVAEEVCAVVKQVMIDAMTVLLPEVPIEVEARVCGTWGEK